MTAIDVPTHRGFDHLDDPSPGFIEDLRRRYPTERETDELLVRKLRRRGGPAYVPVTLAELSDGLQRLLRRIASKVRSRSPTRAGSPAARRRSRWASTCTGTTPRAGRATTA